MDGNDQSDACQTYVSDSLELSPPELAGTSISPQGKAFRWRIIFVTLAMFFGMCALAVSIFHFAMVATFLFKKSVPTSKVVSVMGGDAIGAIAASSLLVTAVNLKKGRWLYAALFFLLGAALGYIAQSLGGGC
jgi:hypothetical protein